MSVKLVLLILLAEALICSAQFLFKAGANNLYMHNLNSIREYVAFIKSSLLVPAIWGGLFMNALAIVIWVIILALVDLSLAIPLDSLHYVVILAGSHFFLKEKITPARIIGTLCIMGGIILVAIS